MIAWTGGATVLHTGFPAAGLRVRSSRYPSGAQRFQMDDLTAVL